MMRRCLTLVIALVGAFLSPLSEGRASLAHAGYTWHLFLNPHPAPLFYQGTGVAVGMSGNIFIADAGDHRVAKFSADGSPITTWGTDASGPLHLDGPRAIAVDNDGNIYLADNGVVKLSFMGRVLGHWTGGVLSYPRGLAVDQSRNLYVLSLHPVPNEPIFDRITITKIDETGKIRQTFVFRYAQPVADAALGAAIATTLQGNLLLSIRAQRHCHSCDGTYYLLRTISPSGRILAEASEDAGGDSVAADRAGDIYVTKPHAVEKLSSGGALLSSFGAPGCGPGQLGADLQVAAAPDGSLIVADSQIAATRPDLIPAPFRAGVLHRFRLDGTPQSLLGTCPAPDASTLFGQINDLAVGSDGTIDVADGIASTIVRVGPSGAVLGAMPALHPSTVAVDRFNNLYVPNLQYDRLEKRAPDGRLLAATSGLTIEAVAVARDLTIYALSVYGEVLVLPPVGHGNRPIRRWWLRGYGPETGGLDPQGICLDGQGHVWVADIRHNNVQEYSSGGRLLRIWGRGGTGPNRFHNPNGLTVDGRGHLFVLDGGNDRVLEFDLRGHFLAMYGRDGQAPGQFLGAWGIGADTRGNIYIGDRGNDRIQELVAG